MLHNIIRSIQKGFPDTYALKIDILIIISKETYQWLYQVTMNSGIHSD